MNYPCLHPTLATGEGGNLGDEGLCGHPDRGFQRQAAGDRTREHAAHRRLPGGGRHPAPGGRGHLRDHHQAGVGQRRLRGRAFHHGQRR